MYLMFEMQNEVMICLFLFRAYTQTINIDSDLEA